MSSNPSFSLEQIIRDTPPEHQESMRLAMEAGRQAYRDQMAQRRAGVAEPKVETSLEYATRAQKARAERSASKPAAAMSTAELRTEHKLTTTQYEGLAREFNVAAPERQREIRSQIEPIVAREGELRREHNGRLARAELAESAVGWGR